MTFLINIYIQFCPRVVIFGHDNKYINNLLQCLSRFWSNRQYTLKRFIVLSFIWYISRYKLDLSLATELHASSNQELIQVGWEREPPPCLIGNTHKKMAVERSSSYFMFLLSPPSPFLFSQKFLDPSLSNCISLPEVLVMARSHQN